MNLNTPCCGHLPQHEEAGLLYLRAREWLAASQCFKQVDNFGRALKVLDEQEMYDQAINCLQRYNIRKQVRLYHWQELPQVSFLSWQIHVCHDKTHLLSWQKYTCSNKTFVTTKFCCDRHVFVTTKVLSWQAYLVKVSLSQQNICCDKIMFVVTNIWLVVLDK